VTHLSDWRAHLVAARQAVVLVAWCVTVVAQSAEPPLPHLALETYPSAAREPLARAHREATARPLSADAVCGLARALHAWEQWEGAHQAYVRCQALAPQVFDGFYLDAIVLQRLARHDAAAGPLRQALVLAPGYLPARVRLAESLLEAGNLDESRNLFESLTSKPTTAPAAELGLGRVEAARGQHERAVAHLQRAIALFPEFGTAYYALARSYRALGRAEEAREALAKHAQYGARWPALEDPVRASLTSVRDDAEANLQRGIRLAEAGDLPGAIAAHEQALARDASLAQAHANLITLYGQRGDLAKAEEHYRAVVALGANLSNAHYDYAVLLGSQKKWDLAADAYRRTLAMDPTHGQARNNLGQLLERQGDINAAADMYREAVASQPTFRLARFNFGRVLLMLGRTEEAIAQLEVLVEPSDAETPRYLYALASANFRAGHKEEGMRWAVEARRQALAYGQTDLAATIDRALAKLK
jgi:tetratricopeptide (TPR) repeat protein